MEDDKDLTDTYEESQAISIHVLRMEDDFFVPLVRAVQFIFQSTSSAWRTTTSSARVAGYAGISIHVLRMEDDGY